jgi:hypothetical protein
MNYIPKSSWGRRLLTGLSALVFGAASSGCKGYADIRLGSFDPQRERVTSYDSTFDLELAGGTSLNSKVSLEGTLGYNTSSADNISSRNLRVGARLKASVLPDKKRSWDVKVTAGAGVLHYEDEVAGNIQSFGDSHYFEFGLEGSATLGKSFTLGGGISQVLTPSNDNSTEALRVYLNAGVSF